MAENETDRDYLIGRALIAMPNMGDARFERSVVLICSHENDHAMGIVVNKQIKELNIGDLLEQMEITADQAIMESPVHYGGPVKQDRGLVVHTLDYRSEHTIIVSDNIGVTGTAEILVDVAGTDRQSPPPSQYFLALGHAGWAAGQLEEEIAMNTWAFCDVNERLLFSKGREDVWKSALKTLGVTAAMLSPEWSNIRDQNAPLN